MCGQRLSTARTSSPSAKRTSVCPPAWTTSRPVARTSASSATFVSRVAVAGLREGPEPAAADGDQLLIGIKLGRIVGKTLGALPADSRCLVRSLVLTSLLARRGISSTLIIGVRSEPKFEAHAWVECAGAPLLSPGDNPYERLVEF